MNTIEVFEQQKYVHLKNFLPLNTCDELTNELKKLVENAETQKDDQCPKSEAIHGSPIFDKLLDYCLPYFEKACGKKLYPTYSYARLYAHDDELQVHIDRESCEISATITLGFNDKCWGIFMGDDESGNNGTEIIMDVGDAVLYKGIEKYHWRNKFEGQWQAQVFLHYVDQDGKYAEWKYDKRECLGISKTSEVKEKDEFDICYLVPNAITDAFCDNIIKEYSKDTVERIPPYIGNKTLDLNIRNVERVELSASQGIGAVLTSIGLNLNNEFWQYNITHSNQTDFLMYNVDGKYESHIDVQHKFSKDTRKLTVLVFLNDDFEGGKFYLQVSNERFYPNQKKGNVLVFPSFILHGVEPVTKGVRYSVVTWMLGDYFK